MLSTYLNMETESSVSQRKTRLAAKRLAEQILRLWFSFANVLPYPSKLTLNLSVNIVYQLFQHTSIQNVQENLDSVLKETLKKSMSALKAIKEQWDSGDAGKSTSFSYSSHHLSLPTHTSTSFHRADR